MVYATAARDFIFLLFFCTASVKRKTVLRKRNTNSAAASGVAPEKLLHLENQHCLASFPILFRHLPDNL